MVLDAGHRFWFTIQARFELVRSIKKVGSIPIAGFEVERLNSEPLGSKAIMLAFGVVSRATGAIEAGQSYMVEVEDHGSKVRRWPSN